MLNSNSYYNILENGNPLRSMEEARREFLNPTTESYLVVLDNMNIGIIDFLKNNPNDNCPWIGLFMIHGNYHSKGYGNKVYISFEEQIKKKNLDKIRIGVLQENIGAIRFWKSLGFNSYKNSQWKEKCIECFEKILR